MADSAWRVRDPVSYPEPFRDEEILEEGVDAVPVRVLIVQDDFVTGWDEGALAFEDAALWFSGRATSFWIGVGDLKAITLPDAFGLSPNYALELYHPSRKVSLKIEVLAIKGRLEWRDDERLMKELDRLGQIVAPSGRSQLPPLSLRPGARLDAIGDWRLAVMRRTFWGFLFLGFARTSALPFVTARARGKLLQTLRDEEA